MSALASCTRPDFRPDSASLRWSKPRIRLKSMRVWAPDGCAFRDSGLTPDPPDPGRLRETREELPDSDSGNGIGPVSANLRERCEREPARAQSRVRQDRVRALPNLSADVQDVDVDLAWSVHEGRRASDQPLDPPDRGEELARRPRPCDLDGGVPEVGLVRKTDGLRPVEGGNAPDRRESRDLAERRLQVGAPVADVGAETEVRERRGRPPVSRTLPRPAGDRLRRSLRLPRTRRPRSALRLLQRAPAPRRTRPGFPRAAAP